MCNQRQARAPAGTDLNRWNALYKDVLKPKRSGFAGPELEFGLATFTRRRQPFRQPETGAAYLEGLRAAGLPD